MFTILKRGIRRRPRLVADAVLQAADFDLIARALGSAPVRARKIAFIAACRTQQSRLVETRWQGEVTSNQAQPGDWIVTSLDVHRAPLRDAVGNLNCYVIHRDDFERLYERAVGESEWGPVFKARAMVDALFLAGGLDIKAPWGRRQTIETGYLLRNGSDIYGNAARSFRATYEIMT
jgi:hypothetical protein